jgi:hypothetical protein
MPILELVIGHSDGASRPAAGISGRLWYVTDADPAGLYRDNGTDWIMVATGINTIHLTIDGQGSVIPTGIAGDLWMDRDCTIISWQLLADQSGSIVVDIWKDTYANYPPTNADSITGATPPTIATAVKAQDTSLDDWTVDIARGDTLRFNVDSATTIERVVVALTTILASPG